MWVKIFNQHHSPPETGRDRPGVTNIPAGSFRTERFLRSSKTIENVTNYLERQACFSDSW